MSSRSRFPPGKVSVLAGRDCRRAARLRAREAIACGGDGDLLGERVDGIARAKFGLRHGPIGQDDRERHGQCALAAQIGEFESERCPIEIELEAMRERPSGLAQCSRNARDGQVWGVVEVLRGQVDDRAILDDSARVDRAGTPQIRPMKCVSWICRSMAGPPLRWGSAISLDQSGFEITRIR